MDEAEWPKNNQELEDYGFEVPQSRVRQPQNAHHHDSNHRQQQYDQNRDDSQRQEYYQSQNAAGAHSQGSARGSLDDLERSLRGGQPAQITGAFRRHEEQITADMKPVEPSDRI